MSKKINWLIWFFSNFVELRISTSITFQDVVVAVFTDFVYNYSDCAIKVLEKVIQEVNLNNEGALAMGIHYDYKSTRGDKAMKKEAKRKARIEQRRAKDRIPKRVQTGNHADIDKPITLEDLTNPDKN